MEVNKEEALRCLAIAKNHYGTGNYPAAVKLSKKSISLYPTDDAKAFLTKAEDKAKNQSSATSSGSNTNASSTTENVKRREHKAQSREFTQEQLDAVKRIRACGTDYYKILSLEKTCTDGEIKKSYRKVRYKPLSTRSLLFCEKKSHEANQTDDSLPSLACVTVSSRQEWCTWSR
jgi:DnaJ family protein B protein 12